KGAVEPFLQLYIGTMTRDPWFPRLIIREVLAEGGPARDRYIKRFAARAATLGPAVIASEIEHGRFRGDLDPVLTLISMIGMAAFPVIAFPVLGKALNLKLDEAFRDRLIAHTLSLFLDGARKREARP